MNFFFWQNCDTFIWWRTVYCWNSLFATNQIFPTYTYHLGWNWVFFWVQNCANISFFIFFNWDYISMWSIGISNTYISTLIKIKIGKKCKKKKKGELNLKKKHWIRIIWNSSILIEKLIRKLRLQATY